MKGKFNQSKTVIEGERLQHAFAPLIVQSFAAVGRLRSLSNAEKTQSKTLKTVAVSQSSLTEVTWEVMQSSLPWEVGLQHTLHIGPPENV